MEFSGSSGQLKNSNCVNTRTIWSKRVRAACAGLAFLATASCGNQGQRTFSDTATSGEIWIGVDDSYKLLFDTEVDVFQSLYPNAKIHIIHGPEPELLKLLNADSIRLAIMGRTLTENEKEAFTKRNSSVTDLKIAVDAVAFISNKKNSDTLLSVSQLQNIFSGKTLTWKQLNEKSGGDSIITVFDSDNSSNARFIKEKFLNGNAFPKNCFAVKSNSEVVSYVEKNKNAIGVIGVNWISDADDSISKNFLKKVHVMAVGNGATADDYYQPYQAYISLNNYPFTRNVYIINHEGRTGLGTGFASFLAGEKGQKIILKSGLLPATMPVRIVNLNQE